MPEDVQRAHQALAEAVQRAAQAQRRLANARQRSHDASRRHRYTVDLGRFGYLEQFDVMTLRDQAAGLNDVQLLTTYLALGGHCTDFELDGFLHALIELPAEELAVLQQAVWELTELSL